MIIVTWFLQSEDDNAKVFVSTDYGKNDEPRTDFLIIDKITGERKRVFIDQSGNETELAESDE